jgi:hypothetical protein
MVRRKAGRVKPSWGPSIAYCEDFGPGRGVEPDSVDASSDSPPSLGRSPSTVRESPSSAEESETPVESTPRVLRRRLGVLGRPRRDLGRSSGELGERRRSLRHPTPCSDRSSSSLRPPASRARTLCRSRRSSNRHKETVARRARTTASLRGTSDWSRTRVAEDSEPIDDDSASNGQRRRESRRRLRENVRGLGEDV